MNAEYKRDLQNNYLILENVKENQDGEYDLRMAEQNVIPGLLRFHTVRRDGRLYLHYEITSRQPLYHVFEKKLMGYNDIISLFAGIQNTVENIQKYLLDPNQLLFDPQFVYLESARNKILLCYLPGCEETQTLLSLAEFVLKRLDHEDRQAVALGYGFYNRVTEENFSLLKTLKELLKTEPSVKTVPQKEIEKETDPDYPLEDENYEVIHKIRDKQKIESDSNPKNVSNPDKKKIDKLFQLIHPAVLVSGLILTIIIEVTYFYRIVNLTEAGGIFFFVLALEILINNYWRKLSDRKKSESDRWTEEEENEMYLLLREEMYDTSGQEGEEIGETRCLVMSELKPGFLLTCIRPGGDPGRYPVIQLNNSTGVLFVGKQKGVSDVLLDSPTVSRLHARLECRGERYFVQDLNSKNGTFLNGERLEPQERRQFSAGDQIRFAEIDYRVSQS